VQWTEDVYLRIYHSPLHSSSASIILHCTHPPHLSFSTALILTNLSTTTNPSIEFEEVSQPVTFSALFRTRFRHTTHNIFSLRREQRRTRRRRGRSTECTSQRGPSDSSSSRSPLWAHHSIRIMILLLLLHHSIRIMIRMPTSVDPAHLPQPPSARLHVRCCRRLAEEQQLAGGKRGRCHSHHAQWSHQYRSTASGRTCCRRAIG
jgi:hypothetical protein